MFHTYYVILSNLFALFLAQNLKTKLLTVQKNLLLECLIVHLPPQVTCQVSGVMCQMSCVRCYVSGIISIYFIFNRLGVAGAVL